MQSTALDAARIISAHVEKRTVVNDSGEVQGDDYWGYLDSGEQWRQIRLYRGGVVAKYGFVGKEQSKLFDRAINSLCYMSDTGR